MTTTPTGRPLGPHMVMPIGFGAMRLTGPGIFGPPRDWQAAVRVLKVAVELGVDHIDTAHYYGPAVVNQLIREALAPFPPNLVIVSKVGARRDDRGGIFAYDMPAQLHKGIEENLRALGVDSLPVVNLRLMRATPPDNLFDDQLSAMVAARDAGLIENVGLSNITLDHLTHALQFTNIACVQNSFHPADRRSRPILDECTRQGIAFVPFAPLGSGARGSGSVLDGVALQRVADRFGWSPSQVALAWALHTSPQVLLIPGTGSVAHVRENVAAAWIDLDEQALDELDAGWARQASGRRNIAAPD
jgi:pyridoxine 4-dehydrogenase